MSNEAIPNAAPVEETRPDPLLSVTEIRTDRVCNSIIRRSPSGQFIIEWPRGAGQSVSIIVIAITVIVMVITTYALHAVMYSTDRRLSCMP